MAKGYVTETGTVLFEGQPIKCHCGRLYDAYNNDGRCANDHPFPTDKFLTAGRRISTTPDGFYTDITD